MSYPPRRISNAVDLLGNSASTLAVTATAAQTAALKQGIYAIWATAACYIAVAADASGVTTANGYIVPASSVVNVFIPEGMKLGGIAAGATTISYHKIGDNG